MITYYTKEGKLTCIYYGDISFSKLHRLDGPAVEWFDGSKEWWVDGKRHRLYGPAIIWHNGTKEWFINGKKHRLDGPAVEYNDGIIEWRIKGKRLSNDEVEAWVKENNINLKIKQHQVLFMVKFG